MDTRTTEKRARARAAKLIRAIALSTIMAATVILPLAVLAETPRGGLDSIDISAPEAAIGVNGDTQAPDLGLNQQNLGNDGNDGSLQGDAGVKAADNEPEAPADDEPEAPADGGSEAPVEGEPEAPVDSEPEAPIDNEPEAPVKGKPEASLDNEPETPVDGEPGSADQTESGFADSNIIDNKSVKSMANGINVLEEDIEGNVYTVGADVGMDYATPADAIVDTGDLRTDDNAPWVMELHQDFTYTNTQPSNPQMPYSGSYMLTIPAGMNLTIRSAAGERYKIDAEGNKRNIYAEGDNISLTLSDVTITGGYAAYAGSYSAGVGMFGANSSLTLEAGSVVSNNQAGHGAGVYITGADASLTMEPGSEISGNSAIYGGGGVSVSSGAAFTMKGGKISGNSAICGGGVIVSAPIGYFILLGGEISNNTVAEGAPTGGFTANSGAGVIVRDNDYSRLTIPEGAEVAFFGNKTAGDPYLLSDADRITPPRIFEGRVTSLSVEDINEANGFDAGDATANNKSVFNDYDIGYRAGTPFTNIYTVGPGEGMDYATPADALKDTDGVRNKDGLEAGDFWVMELHDDFTLDGKQLSIPAGANLKIRSAKGKRYKIDADKKSRVIYAYGDNISLTLADVTIMGGALTQGAGVCVYGTGSSLTLGAGCTVSNNSTGAGDLGYGGGVYIYGKNVSLTMEAGSTVSDNRSEAHAGGVYFGGTDATFTMRGGVISGNSTNYFGGGIRTTGTNVAIIMEAGSVISGNSVSSDSIANHHGGGGVYFWGGDSVSLIMKAGSRISDNTVNGYGGGVVVSSTNDSTNSLTMEAGSIITNNSAGRDGGGVCLMRRDNTNPSLLVLKGGEISNNTANNGGGVYADYRSNGEFYEEDAPPISIPAGAQVAFSGNKASGTPYALSEADRITPPATFEGAITSLSVEGINEANGFDVGTIEAIVAANKKSVFNNYDIAYTAGTQLDVLTISYLDENSAPISEAETLLYQGKAPYPLPGLPGSPKQGMGWSLTEASDGLVVSTAGGAVGKGDVLAPASGLSFNLAETVTSHRVSVKFAPAPYTYTVRFLDYDGTELSAQRVSHGAAATPPASPTRVGYSFTGWSAGFDGITADTDITARYEALTTPPPTPGPTPGPTPTPIAPIAPVAPEPKPESAPESKPESTPGSTTASTEGSGTETPTAKTPAAQATPPTPNAGQTTAPVAGTPAAGYPATDETTGPNAATAAETGAGAGAGAGNEGNEAESGQGTGNAKTKSAGSPLALLSGNGEIVSQDELRELARKAGVPLVGIGDRAVPLIGIDGYAFWSLADLAIILFAAAIAAWNILAYRRRRGQGGLAAATETGGNARPLPIAILTIAIANAALFLLSQDFAAAPLVLVDIWTIPEATLFIVECMLARVVGMRANAMYGDSEEIGNPIDVRSA